MNRQDLLGECEAILADRDALRRCSAIEPRRREDQHADLRLLFSERAWLQSEAGARLVARLQRHPAVASALRRKSAILLRFEDAALAATERRLAAGALAAMYTDDVLAGRRFTVSSVGPNTNKALHVGHLRNIVLGEALSCALTSAGAQVRRHTLVGDIGRRVCEAMGGYVAHHDGETPEDLGLAGDRFVELCSNDFPRGYAQSTATGRQADPNAEEIELCGDSADAIMRAWLLGDASVRELWQRLRGWALTGHRRTLARLGVRMDRCDFESEQIRRALDLLAEGLERGLFEREAAGGVVYRTGRSEYATMVLLREDGFPTEYARLLGVYDRILEALGPGELHVEVVGIEWQQPSTVLRELLGMLRQGPRSEAFVLAFHGLVTVGGQKMGSSTGAVTWIEDFLDEVAAGPGVRALQELAGGALAREELADLVVRGAFLCSPTARPLAFALEQLIEGAPGPGWTIAEAWCRAQRSRRQELAAPVARTAIVQAQLFPRSLRRAVEKLDVAGLASYLLGLSEAFLAAPEPGAAAAPMLRGVLSSLGFQAAVSDWTAPRAVRQLETIE
jgi:arginyl-tRNA synthetase